jgi:hypothetical protein
MKNIDKNYILFVFIIACHLLVSCSVHKESTLQSESVYNKNELKSISKLLTSFDEYVIKISEEKKVDSAYHLFFENMRYPSSVEDFKTKSKMGFPSHKSLIADAGESKAFDIIWEYSYNRDIYTFDTISTDFTLNLDGKYLIYLKRFGKFNEIINEYQLAVEASGEIPPSIAYSFFHLHNKFDFNKPYNRFIWMVHFISITSERKYKKRRG